MGKGVGWTVSSSDLWAPRRWKSPLTVTRPAPDVPIGALVRSSRCDVRRACYGASWIGTSEARCSE